MELEEIDKNNFNSKNKNNYVKLKSFGISKKYVLYLFILSSLLFLLILKTLSLLFSKTLIYQNKSIFTLVYDKDIIKPLTDRRTYEIIQLDNDIQCVLISDENATRTGVSLSINVEGYSSDISEFTMHVLINNTQIGQQFKEMLKSYYGTYKISYENDISSYYYDIDCNGFNKTFNQFIQMIFKPNFINDDMEGNQRYYIEMDLSSLKHTYSSVTNDEVNLFSIKLVDQYISNKKEDNISGMLSAITQLIKNYYLNSNNVKLSIISNHSIDEMKEIVYSNVKLIKFKNDTVKEDKVKYENTKIGKIFYHEAKRKKNIFNFVAKCYNDTKGNSLSYAEFISYITNDYDNYSLYGVLHRKNLIKHLTSKVIKISHSSPNYFVIALELTDEGLNNIYKISSYVISYINQLNDYANYIETFSDLKTINEQKFKYLTITKYNNYLNKISSKLFTKSYSDILYHAYNIPNYDYSQILKVLSNSVKIENFAIVIEVDRIDSISNLAKSSMRYQGMKYYIEDINQEELNKLIIEKKFDDEQFIYKSKNPYVSNVDYIEEIEGTKEQIEYETDVNEIKNKLHRFNVDLYYKLDRSFKVPRVQTYFLFNYYFPKEIETFYAENSYNFNSDIQILFFNRIKSKIKMNFVEAELAGNNINLYFIRNKGFILQLSAYVDIAPNLIKEILYSIASKYNYENINDDDFNDITYNNMNEKYIDFLLSVHYNKKEIRPTIVLSEMNKDVLVNFYKYFINNFEIVSLVYGMAHDELINNISEFLLYYTRNNVHHQGNKKQKDTVSDFYVNKCILYRYHYSFWNDNKNYMLNTIIIGERTISNELMSDLLIELWQEQFKLYSKVEKIYFNDNIFIRVIKTSDKNEYKMTPDNLGDIAMKEMQAVKERIHKMDSKFLEKEKDKLIKKKRKKELRLKDKAEKAWYQIYEGRDYDQGGYDYGTEMKKIDKMIFNTFVGEKFENHLFLSFQFWADSHRSIAMNTYLMFEMRNLQCEVI